MKQDVIVRTWRWLGMFLFVAAMATCLTNTAYAADDPEPCSANVESRQLDYWLGNWNITVPGRTADNNSKSKVYLSLDKCVVIESWEDGRGHAGENMFAYNAENKRWYGMFADNRGHVHVFVDGKVGAGSAEFFGPSRGPNGEAVLHRIKVVRLAPDKVEQLWEKSTDNGATWTEVFRGEYLRAKS
ncbi:MAG TPA: hypothetical protein VKH81_12165 [Candidatus Angelobacter sp.]|nr:hypothetical protein [Candidatus Angelobacter sp.]